MFENVLKADTNWKLDCALDNTYFVERRVPPSLILVALACPVTSSLYNGFVEPMPTLPISWDKPDTVRLDTLTLDVVILVSVAFTKLTVVTFRLENVALLPMNTVAVLDSDVIDPVIMPPVNGRKLERVLDGAYCDVVKLENAVKVADVAAPVANGDAQLEKVVNAVVVW